MVPIHTMRFATDDYVELADIDNITGVQKKHLEKGNFNYAYAYRFPNGVCMRIWCNPLPNRLVSGWAVIELELSSFQNWNDFVDFKSLICPDIDPLTARIKRLDLYVDVHTALSVFKRGLLIPRKRKLESIKSSSDTYIIGRKPVYTVIYDKAATARLPKVLTRVEVRFYGGKCPVRHLAYIKDLLDFDPFENFLLYEFIGGPDRILNEGIERAVLRDGLQHALRKDIGRARFNKLVQRGYFRKLAEPDLSSIYRQNLRAFLGGGA